MQDTSNSNIIRIDMSRIIKYLIRHIWLPAICALIGMGILYWHVTFRLPDTFTSSGTMYVYNANPNMINYQYASSGDLDSAVQLIETYLIVVRSNKVLDVVTERLSKDYPNISPDYISSTLSMESVSKTGVVRVSSKTQDPKMSTDIANAVLDVAPSEIIRVVGVGSIEIIDYAEIPKKPDTRNPLRRSLAGGLVGFGFGCVVVLILLFMDHRILDVRDVSESYTPPVLCSVRREKGNPEIASLLLRNDSPMDRSESYSKLRMNLLHVLKGKEKQIAAVTSAISGEGKSTIVSSLAVSCAIGGKKTLLIDADLRRNCQSDIFQIPKDILGLSDILAGNARWQDQMLRNIRDNLDLLPAGTMLENPTELLESSRMAELMNELEKEYELILLDLPPINIVSDPLAVSSLVTGCLMVVRQNYSDHREIRNALISAEMVNMNVMGFIFYGENITQGSYYNRRYYKSYYKKYDNRRSSAGPAKPGSGEQKKESKKHEKT